MVTKKEFLKAKLENFKQFLKTIKDSASATNSLLSQVETFSLDEDENLVKFSQFIIFKVKPSIKSLDIFIDNMMKEQNISIELTLEQREKLKKYLELFCEIICT
jgi:hypothetical protein